MEQNIGFVFFYFVPVAWPMFHQSVGLLVVGCWLLGAFADLVVVLCSCVHCFAASSAKGGHDDKTYTNVPNIRKCSVYSRTPDCKYVLGTAPYLCTCICIHVSIMFTCTHSCHLWLMLCFVGRRNGWSIECTTKKCDSTLQHNLQPQISITRKKSKFC